MHSQTRLKHRRCQKKLERNQQKTRNVDKNNNVQS